MENFYLAQILEQQFAHDFREVNTITNALANHARDVDHTCIFPKQNSLLSQVLKGLFLIDEQGRHNFVAVPIDALWLYEVRFGPPHQIFWKLK
jgi:hypothetical protein